MTVDAQAHWTLKRRRMKSTKVGARPGRRSNTIVRCEDGDDNNDDEEEVDDGDDDAAPLEAVELEDEDGPPKTRRPGMRRLFPRHRLRAPPPLLLLLLLRLL